MLRFFIFNWALLFRLFTGAAISTWMLSVSGFLESQLFYWPARGAYHPEGAQQPVTFPTADGLTLHALFWPAAESPDRTGPAPTILFVHGNMGNASDYGFCTRFLPEAGFNVLTFDYRAFGPSDAAHGPIYREHLLADTHAALDYLLIRPDVDPDRIGLYGMSLGASLGLTIAAERSEIKSIAAMAGFARWRKIAADHFPVLGWVLIRSGHEPVDAAARLGDRQLLILHGDRDQTVPFEHACELEHAACSAGVPTTLHLVPDGAHITLFSIDPEIDDVIIEFFRASLSPETP